MLTAGYITAPRTGVNYLPESLESLFYYLYPNVHVFAEPGSPKTSFNVTWIEHQKRLGLALNTWFALNYLLKVDNSPFILFCEDDACWTRKAADAVREMMQAPKANAFFSPYCSKVCGDPQSMPGWQFADLTHGWCGNLTLLFPREILGKMLAVGKEKFLTYAGESHYHVDTAIGKLAEDAGVDIYVHVPSLIYHRGTVSTNEAVNASERKYQSHARQACL